MKKAGRLLIKLFIGFLLLSIGSVILFRFVPVPFTPLMLIRLVEQALDPEQNIKCSKKWKPIEKVSVHIQRAVIASEDQKFSEHFGFDREAISKAIKFNKKYKGKRIKGASTISQQTAKNLFLWPSRNWLRKGLEVYFTLLIELLWSKERILEVYLNIIETGNGIYGVEMAAQSYFKKPASKLTLREASLIAACIPNPRKWKPNQPTPYVLKRQTWIARQINNIEWNQPEK